MADKTRANPGPLSVIFGKAVDSVSVHRLNAVDNGILSLDVMLKDFWRNDVSTLQEMVP